MLPSGVYPAAVTPLTDQRQLCVPSLARLLTFFETAGCAGVVLGGTNGEGPSFGAPFRRNLVAEAIPLRGRLKVLLGLATSGLDEAIWLSKQAAKLGADGVLALPPFFWRDAPEEGALQWMDALLEASPLPVLVYNFPKRCGFTIQSQHLERWSRWDAFAGVKDSSGEHANLTEYQVGAERSRFVGDETLLQDALRAGWNGSISGLANVAPHVLVKCLNDPTLFQFAVPTFRQLRGLSQPATHKAVLKELGILSTSVVAPPLVEAEETQVRLALKLLRESFGILPGALGLPSGPAQQPQTV